MNKGTSKMKSKNGALQFMSGFLFIIMAISVLLNGFKGVFIGSSRWIVGIGFIIFGLLNIYESKDTYKSIKETHGFWNKVKMFIISY